MLSVQLSIWVHDPFILLGFCPNHSSLSSSMIVLFFQPRSYRSV
jgi:hypothetical protein